jgi:hypothetical protein
MCHNEKEKEDNDRFYEVNPLLDSQPGGKINTEPSSSSSSFLNRQQKKNKKRDTYRPIDE